MNTRKKKFVKTGIINPLIISIIITTLFFAIYNIAVNNIFFKEREFTLSSYLPSDLVEAPNYNISSQDIRKTQLPLPEDNAVIGSAVIGGQAFDIVYNANEINASTRLNLIPSGSLIGENGTSFLRLSKKDSAPLKALKLYDSITLDTYYSSYEYTVCNIKVLGSYSELERCADEYGKAVIIYTDACEGYGVSDTYYAVICQKASGADITE